MLDLIGRTLKGKFEITAKLGAGAMGAVFRGVDVDSEQDVAVKVLHPALTKEPGMLTRFFREARAMRRVRHPNAVRVIEHGVEDGLAFLVMELVEGRTLAELLDAGMAVTPERAVHILVDICEALAVVHVHGLVHRDIKPANIMLTGPAGVSAKLIDFGIAKHQSSAPQGEISGEELDLLCEADTEVAEWDDLFDVTSTGMTVGSPGYMAPEQWAGGKVDARSDVYACGAVLYQLLTGRVPFEDQNVFRMVTRQAIERPEPPHFLNPEVPAALSMIVLRALMPVAEDRYATAGHLRDALNAYTLERAIHHRPELVAPTIPVNVAALRPAETGIPVDVPMIPNASLKLPPLSITFSDVSTAAPRISLSRSTRDEDIGPLWSAWPALVSLKPARRKAALAAYTRALLPLAAAFVTLGVILGVLFFLPAPR